MENYSDSVIPPLSALSPLPKTNINEMASSSRKRSRAQDSQSNPVEIQKERDRREKMSELFSVLQSMVSTSMAKVTGFSSILSKSSGVNHICSLMILMGFSPFLELQATRVGIIDETIDRIKYLEEELKGLNEQKGSETAPSKPVVSFSTHRSSSVDVTVSGNVAFFGVNSMVRQKLVMEVFMVFEKHRAEVLAANVAVNDRKLTLTVTALVNGNGDEIVDGIKRDLLILLF
ncbi:hypothetical protein HHK36_012480 [Tetracentron sinense]|uniref:BHLH domain-containing protein n=1 Tax=Tetracentron sinense TaxID=13715 RepID=A0A835DEL5_TETSI|nr:hypothetical protein HHK36_012480 [Tetracentron sinense]